MILVYLVYLSFIVIGFIGLCFSLKKLMPKPQKQSFISNHNIMKNHSYEKSNEYLDDYFDDMDDFQNQQVVNMFNQQVDLVNQMNEMSHNNMMQHEMMNQEIMNNDMFNGMF